MPVGAASFLFRIGLLWLIVVLSCKALPLRRRRIGAAINRP
jgi:hypothetical protein